MAPTQHRQIEVKARISPPYPLWPVVSLSCGVGDQPFPQESVPNCHTKKNAHVSADGVAILQPQSETCKRVLWVLGAAACLRCLEGPFLHVRSEDLLVRVHGTGLHLRQPAATPVPLYAMPWPSGPPACPTSLEGPFLHVRPEGLLVRVRGTGLGVG